MTSAAPFFKIRAYLLLPGQGVAERSEAGNRLATKAGIRFPNLATKCREAATSKLRPNFRAVSG